METYLPSLNNIQITIENIIQPKLSKLFKVKKKVIMYFNFIEAYFLEQSGVKKRQITLPGFTV
ncbi:hypothetical protein pb186bvf_015519 [Paramecium bursaria]